MRPLGKDNVLTSALLEGRRRAWDMKNLRELAALNPLVEALDPFLWPWATGGGGMGLSGSVRRVNMRSALLFTTE